MLPRDYLVTRADALAGARLHHLGYVGGCFCLAVTACCAGFVGGLIYAVTQPSPGALSGAGIAAGGIFVGLYALLLVRHAILPLIVVHRMFREQKNVRQTHMLSWSERSYVLQGPTGHLDMPWGDYWRWREDGHVLLLYHSSKLYQLVPKRLLTAADVADVRGYLQQAGVPRWRLFLG